MVLLAAEEAMSWGAACVCIMQSGVEVVNLAAWDFSCFSVA
jgi:hypothetical protein